MSVSYLGGVEGCVKRVLGFKPDKECCSTLSGLWTF